MGAKVFLHDGSFEGLLHGVAAAAKAGDTVKGVYAEPDFRPDLFSTCIRVSTDSQQAARLFRYLRSLKGKASHYAINGHLSENSEVGTHLYRLVAECLVRGPAALQMYANDSLRFLDQLARKVDFEAHRMNGLIRFRILDNGLQYAPFVPDYNITCYCAEHFRARLGTRRWILHDVRRDIAVFWDCESLQRVEIATDFTDHVRRCGEIPLPFLTGGEKRYQDLWRSFHRVIANEDRENSTLQRQLMPRRYWKYLIEQPNRQGPAG